jgi:6-pyruvoyltetrahydropterin/6-carboxytetrahydropterin synthase
MRIATEFRWEMGHRLPNHKGECKNIHGHSYKMIIELSGELDAKSGMIVDFYDLGLIVKPIVKKFDHSFLVYKNDTKLLYFLTENKMKKVVTDYYGTVENICNNFIDLIVKGIKKSKLNNIYSITVKIYETPNSYAEMTKIIEN